MAKRQAHQRRHGPRVALLTMLAALLSLTFLYRSAEAYPDVRIEWTFNSNLGSIDTLIMQIDDGDGALSFNSFDILLSYDPTLVTLVDVLRGDMLTECGWEYFTFRTGAAAECQGTCPDGLIRIIGIAEDPVSPAHPACLSSQGGGILARLVFQIPNDTSLFCADAWIEFFWGSCDDNSLRSVADDSLFVADSVFRVPSPGYPPLPTPTSLGTNSGIPELCLAGPISGRLPARSLNFTHGLVDLQCGPPNPSTGDLNLNGIPYEIADALLFQDYFFQGLDALSPDPATRAEQIIVSDINLDGTPLSYRDFAYMILVITGDALPLWFPLPPPDTVAAVFSQDPTGRSVSVNSVADLASGVFYFTGDIVPTFYVPYDNSGGTFIQQSGKTVIAAQPFAGRGKYRNGIWFTYSGYGILDSVITADWPNNVVVPTIQTITPQTACGNANYDHLINISDIVYLIRHIFSGGAPPLDGDSGDVDCSGAISIADVVLLIQYVFAGGMAPCQNCP